MATEAAVVTTAIVKTGTTVAIVTAVSRVVELTVAGAAAAARAPGRRSAFYGDRNEWIT